MQASVQFLGAGTPDGGAKSVMLNVEGHRYLFNCSPGTQRCALQYGVRLSRIEAVFFTDLTWKSIGGFKGLAATLADLEPPLSTKIKVVGPPGLISLFAASHAFLRRAIHFLELIEVTLEAYKFDDGIIKVDVIRDTSMIYLVHGPKVPGVFDVVKAKAMGLKPGPLYKQLLEGHNIVVGDVKVKPDDVVTPSKPFPKILITEGKDLSIEHDIKICYSNFGASSEAVFVIPHLSLEPVFRDTLELEHRLSAICPQFHSSLYNYRETLDIIKPLDEHIILPRPQLRRQPPMTLSYADPLGISEEVVVTLGTGGAMPGKYRSVSATLLNLKDMKGLFDCGEATFGQLIRKYGHDHRVLVDELDFIAITHLHSDHHLGLLSILEARLDATSILCVLVPRPVHDFVCEYQQVARREFRFVRFVVLEDVEEVQLNERYRLQKIPVDHCDGACGFLLWRGDNKIIGYSGDTRPCTELVKHFKGVEIVVHEATMPDDLAEEAILRKHCTVQEALDVVRQISPTRAAILTHFSQRFGKELPPLRPNIIMASDFMHVLLESKPKSKSFQLMEDDSNRHRILQL